MVIFKRRNSKKKERLSENQIESPTDVLLSYAAKTIQSYFNGEVDLLKVADAFDASLAIIRHVDATKTAADTLLSEDIYSVDNPKLSCKNNFYKQKVNDVLRQSTVDIPASENNSQALNREELSFR